ncbi:uncharacterized protein YjiS (DUF1127 family) [Mycoplana sp. BE70]|uniref:DUF1127 domain-containing protein n=1 Tax=Mycoplana sp. BE70 TaxID=2817775 RepID=UPI00285DC75D|nr:DUF1127 domain-containing protein [Mycoplana sp. BE70]MDR6756273.1 uncharacterized protein YjiS (DUF1127 family) [Mycoplana sp. BE70]
MRMIESQFGHGVASYRSPVASVLAGLRMSATRIVRTWRNRSALNRLHDLDDHMLLDIGLRREDVRNALISSYYWADPDMHLTITARDRARRHLRSGRPD